MHRYIIYLVLLFLASGMLYSQKLYWVDGPSGRIQSCNLDGTSVTNLVTGIGSAYAIQADLTNSKLYWADNTNKAIKSSTITGASAATLITQAAGAIGNPRGIALNVTGNKIYWSDNGTKKIRRADLSGSNVQDVVSALGAPGFITFDAANNKLYYADNGRSVKTIYRCNADGTGIEQVVTGLSQIRGIALNIPENTIYWIDNGTKKIQKGSLASLPVTKTDVITGLSGKLRGLAIDASNSLMYWADVAGSCIRRSNTDGSNIITLVGSVPFPQGVAINWNAETLPVELVSFRAEAANSSVVLSWTTAVEMNNYGFEVERRGVGEGVSGRGGEWEKIGFVYGCGNSNSSKEYIFRDDKAPAGEVEYRLKQIDNDGHFKYYDAVSLNVDAPGEYRLIQNSPNPFNPSTAIKYQLPKNEFVSIIVYDQLGKEIAKLVSEEKPAGSHIVYWNGKDSNGQMVSSGMYLYRLSAGSYSETRKMNFIK